MNENNRLRARPFGKPALVLRIEPNLRWSRPKASIGAKGKTMECTKAERLAAKLDGMVSAKVLPGLLPEDVSAAAVVLREQNAELKTLRAALATKEHIVNVTVSNRRPYSKDLRGEFVITDPRIYYGEIRVDDQVAYASADQHDWQMHVARQLVRVATADWLRALEERAFVGIRADSDGNRNGRYTEE